MSCVVERRCAPSRHTGFSRVAAPCILKDACRAITAAAITAADSESSESGDSAALPTTGWRAPALRLKVYSDSESDRDSPADSDSPTIIFMPIKNCDLGQPERAGQPSIGRGAVFFKLSFTFKLPGDAGHGPEPRPD